ncbi:methyltransferase domain-containing protein [Neolewinella aurantiaca]|uniref:Methyltransferase domain-containing protein n=1 Tax=Neolewinella aurantiaca TaxID=2602767 RepID=A0A5C7FTN2_9BACT|nr:methyltransferase domain-containing protein [Neolewinella aurantiaca]TXF89847.1 methyltransferase domain-containing protein [Neolewinella aurantiaca]
MATLNTRIKDFYDASTPLWLNTWGEQMHHGFYGPDGKRKVAHQQAQLDMIDELLSWGQSPAKPTYFLDAGCGVGGSSRYLALKHLGAKGLGVTLSPVQAENGMRYNREAGVDDRLEIRAQDVYTLDPVQDGPFDLIYSMESAEHMEDKQALLDLFYSLLRSGGQLVMATWCHREEPPALSAGDEKVLSKICELYHLPPLVSVLTLGQAAEKAGFRDVATDDWSAAVEPFWGAVISSGLDPRNWPGLIGAGMSTIKGAWAMKYMKEGFRTGAIRYGVLRGSK